MDKNLAIKLNYFVNSKEYDAFLEYLDHRIDKHKEDLCSTSEKDLGKHQGAVRELKGLKRLKEEINVILNNK